MRWNSRTRWSALLLPHYSAVWSSSSIYCYVADIYKRFDYWPSQIWFTDRCWLVAVQMSSDRTEVDRWKEFRLFEPCQSGHCDGNIEVCVGRWRCLFSYNKYNIIAIFESAIGARFIVLIATTIETTHHTNWSYSPPKITAANVGKHSWQN